MQTWNRALSVILISLVGVGCGTKDSMIPQPEHDMKTVYDKHMQGIGAGQLFDSRSVLRRPVIESDLSLSNYVRTEKTMLDAKFKTLPNPTMYMFVSPHLASDNQVPIPGYLTQFKMWEREHFALPSEISDMQPYFGGQ